MASVEKKQTTTYNLQLTEDEAKTLMTVLYKVGGSPTKSARKHIDDIRVSLRERGITKMAHFPASGHIYFDKNES